MKPLSFVFSLFFIVTLVACNGVGNKDTLIARIGNENVYQEDLDLLYDAQWGSDTAPEYKQAIEDFFTQTAQVSQFLQENPEFEAKWKRLNSLLESQFLALTYTKIFLSNNLGYSDEVLGNYMKKHPEKFGENSSFKLNRSYAAAQLYLEENADSLERFIEKSMKEKEQSEQGNEFNRDEFRDQTKNFFVLLRRESLFNELKKILDENKEFAIEEQKPENPEIFFNEHKDSFKTVPGYELYHIAMSDSLQLATLPNVSEGMALDSFKAVARNFSQDSLTASNGGYIGRVKDNYAIPYGIGMMSALFVSLREKSSGYVSDVIRSESDGLYHVFYLAANIPSEQKSFDRAKSSINQVFGEDVNNFAPSAVVLSKAGNPIFREKDIRTLFSEGVVSEEYGKKSRTHILEVLREASIIANETKPLNVNHSWEYRALVRHQRLQFMYQSYRKMLSKQEIDSEQYNQIAVLEYMLKYAYLMKRDVVCAGSPYEVCREKLEEELRKAIFASQAFRLQIHIWNKVKVSFYNSKWESLCAPKSSDYYLDKARSLARSQEVQKSIDVINRILPAFVDDETALQKIILEAAQIQSDASLFDDAEKNYEAFYTIWPEHPEAEKAMFSRGFILNENLHKDKEALQVLEAFCKKYPGSELRESAEWLMADIKSSGKLAEDLMKQIDASRN